MKIGTGLLSGLPALGTSLLKSPYPQKATWFTNAYQICQYAQTTELWFKISKEERAGGRKEERKREATSDSRLKVTQPCDHMAELLPEANHLGEREGTAT